MEKANEYLSGENFSLKKLDLIILLQQILAKAGACFDIENVRADCVDIGFQFNAAQVGVREPAESPLGPSICHE